MADYSTISAAVSAGITNMTVTRNNSKNDDGTDTVTGVSWFHFNSVAASNIYVSGNSWIGFGTGSQQLGINRRDCASWYVYTESGLIGTHKFFKIRWIGYSAYAQQSDDYLQQYDVFIFDTGEMYLNYYDVPTLNCDGTNSLICGAATINFTVTTGTACEFTFTPSSSATGTGWAVAAGKPTSVMLYKTSGSAIFAQQGLNISDISSSAISWTENKPSGTNIAVSTSTDGTNYTAVTNGGSFVSGNIQDVYIKAELSTTDTTVTPSVSDITLVISSHNDAKSIVLEMSPLQRFESATGDITVAYNGTTLMGQGGSVQPFSVSFTPSGLVYKGDQDDAEHLQISDISTVSNLIRVYYTNSPVQDLGHLQLTDISCTGVLTNVNNL